MNDLEVSCYSGHTYAEGPRSFRWRGVGYEIKEIVKSWREPGQRCFLVKTGGNKIFKLCYNEAKDTWTLTVVAGR